MEDAQQEGPQEVHVPGRLGEINPPALRVHWETRLLTVCYLTKLELNLIASAWPSAFFSVGLTLLSVSVTSWAACVTPSLSATAKLWWGIIAGTTAVVGVVVLTLWYFREYKTRSALIRDILGVRSPVGSA
jgi:hypothetical protein